MSLAFKPIGIISGLLAGMLVEGAIFRVVRGFAEHGARHGFAALAGDWPGEESPEASED